MNYIFLDLEWNSAYSVREGRFVNEIIQIGAVKLNSDLNEIGRFSVTVRSCLSKKLSRRFIELTGITNEQMQSGIPFKNAVEQYNKWADADNCVTFTYSTSDLYAIYENCNVFLNGKSTLNIVKYANLQTVVQGFLNSDGFEIKNQISLTDAANLLNIDTTVFDMHTAFDDSLVSAELFKICYGHYDINSIICDVSDPEFFKKLTFKSHPITSLNSAEIDTEKLRFRCEFCDSKTKRRTKWKYNNRWFKADFICPRCNNRFVGKVSFIKTYDGVVCKRKIIYPKVVSGNYENDVQPMSETV